MKKTIDKMTLIEEGLEEMKLPTLDVGMHVPSMFFLGGRLTLKEAISTKEAVESRKIKDEFLPFILDRMSKVLDLYLGQGLLKADMNFYWLVDVAHKKLSLIYLKDYLVWVRKNFQTRLYRFSDATELRFWKTTITKWQEFGWIRSDNFKRQKDCRDLREFRSLKELYKEEIGKWPNPKAWNRLKLSTHRLSRLSVVKDNFKGLKVILAWAAKKQGYVGLDNHELGAMVSVLASVKNDTTTFNKIIKIIEDNQISIHDGFVELDKVTNGLNDATKLKWVMTKAYEFNNDVTWSAFCWKLSKILLNWDYLVEQGWAVNAKDSLNKALEFIEIKQYGDVGEYELMALKIGYRIKDGEVVKWEEAVNNCKHQSVPAPGGVKGISVGKVTLKQLGKGDPLNYFIGDFTGCCQTIRSAGSDCCEFAVKDPRGATWVVSVGETIIAQSFVWVDVESGSLIIDNIEGLGHHSHVEDIKQAYYLAMESIKGIFGIKDFYQGTSHNDVELYVNGKHIGNPFKQGVLGYAYSDAGTVVKLDV